MQVALQASNLGLWEANLATGAMSMAASWCNVTGYSFDEAPTNVEALGNLMHLDDIEPVKQARTQNIAGDASFYQVDYRLRHKAGHWIWITSAGRIVEHDAAGKPLRAVGSIQNISQQRRIQQESTALLSRIEAMIRALADSSGRDGSFSPDAGGTEKPPPLTDRQLQILTMVASGLTSAEIAERLHLALGTVFSHRRDIMEKLGVRGAAELVRYAIRHKLVPV